MQLGEKRSTISPTVRHDSSMPRPDRPMLSRKIIVTAALAIIDADGLEAFSLTRLAREMGVQAPSLYHHFPDKASILEAVARSIIRETPQPVARDTDDWIEYFVALSLLFRRTILRHAHAAPILLEFMPREVFTPAYETSATFLEEVGIPPHLHVLVLDGLDRLTLGAALTDAMKAPAGQDRVFPHADPQQHPALVRAIGNNALDPETLWVESVRTFLRGIDAMRPETPARPATTDAVTPRSDP